jgi:membrane protein YqaA with SNARE-associated domain
VCVCVCVSVLLPKCTILSNVALANILGSLLHYVMPYFTFPSFPDNNLKREEGKR